MKHSYIDEYSGRDSFIHRLDPRVKGVFCFAFIFFVMSTRMMAFPRFILYFGFISSLALLARLPVNYVFRRSLSIIPFVLFVAAFIPFLNHGEGVVYHLRFLNLSVTRAGFEAFWNCLSKAYLSVLSMILLTSSTQFTDLLKVFEKIGIPLVFIKIISFMYRYLFVVQDELEAMLLAREARTVSSRGMLDFKSAGSMIGVLFIRAYEKSEAVYLAMCARGFDGQIKTLSRFCLRAKDVLFLCAALSILALIRFW